MVKNIKIEVMTAILSRAKVPEIRERVLDDWNEIVADEEQSPEDIALTFAYAYQYIISHGGFDPSENQEECDW